MNALLAVFAALGAIGGLGGIAAVAYIGVTRRKINAEARKLGVEADDVLSGRALEMYDRAMSEARDAKTEAQSCRAELRALHDHVDRLERIMRNADLDPPAFRWPLYEIGGTGQ